MQDRRTASQRWASRDKRPGSIFHELIVIPTFMPEQTLPYQLPGMQPGTSALDQCDWAQEFVQSVRNAQGSQPLLSPEPDQQSTTSPSPPTQHVAGLEQTSTPPLRQDPPPPANISTPSVFVLESQQSQFPARDPSGEIVAPHSYDLKIDIVTR